MDYIPLDEDVQGIESKDQISIIIVVILSIIATSVAICGNLTVIIAIIKDHRLRSASNYFFVSLACCDAYTASVSLPLYTFYWLKGEWLLGDVPCKMWLILDFTACTTQLFTIYTITVDRYLSVTKPVKYRSWVTKPKIFCLMAITWVVPLVVFTNVILFYHPPGVTIPEKQCYPKFSSIQTFVIIMNLIRFWIPTPIMLVLYGRIFMVARNMSSKLELRKKSSGHKSTTHNSTSHMTSYLPGEATSTLNPLPNANNNQMISSCNGCLNVHLIGTGGLGYGQKQLLFHHGNGETWEKQEMMQDIQMPYSFENPKTTLSSSHIDKHCNTDQEHNGCRLHANNQFYEHGPKTSSTKTYLTNVYKDDALTPVSPLSTTMIKKPKSNSNNNSNIDAGTGNNQTNTTIEHSMITASYHIEHDNVDRGTRVLLEGSSVDPALKKESIKDSI